MTDTTDPIAPAPDDKDWTWVLTQPCPECDFDPAEVARADLPGIVTGTARAFASALAYANAVVRPGPAVWSPLEYAAHVRDVNRMTLMRVRLMLSDDDPTFTNWDQDETALADRYWEQSPDVVSAELATSADDLAALFAEIPDDQWSRPGRRRNGSRFTVETLGVYVAHDLVHHRYDISAVL